ncbi:MAG TPA: GNAT family protein [Candidatus Lumbricidophila sp.]|nr:GNAT family protein [Candidatus Lumbricidophila sp.]
MAAHTIPTLSAGAVTLRPIQLRDAKVLDRMLIENRTWLRQWEATYPDAMRSFDTRAAIRNLLVHAREGNGLPFLMVLDGQPVGQLNVSSIVHGSLSSASVGYWVTRAAAGKAVTPTGVALATDYCFEQLRLHRIEICIRPENTPSLRVVEKLGFRYEGLRRRYIHINGEWRDHYAFALVREEVPNGVLRRWKDGQVPPVAAVPDADREAAEHPIATFDLGFR